MKVRSNADRFDGEDDVPDWFYEDGVIFLPEEIESGFRIHDGRCGGYSATCTAIC